MSAAPSARPRPPRPVYAVALAAAILVALASWPVPRITPDAAVYLTGAESIAEAGSYETCVRKVTEYAPGYPAALAGFVVGGLDATDAARLVNVLAAAVLVLGAAALARAGGLGRTAAIAVAVAAAVAPVTLRNGAAAWSELTFSAILVLLLLVVLDGGRGLEVRASRRLAVALVLAWSLLLVRYSGILVVPALVLAAWLGSRQVTMRAGRTALFAGAVLSVPGLWYARNLALDSGIFGSRSESRFSVLDVLGQVPDGLSSLVVPVDVPVALRIAVLVPLLVAVGLAYRRRGVPELVLGTAVAAYVLGIAYAATQTVLDGVDARLLSPVAVPGAVLVALGVGAAGVRALRAYAVALVAGMALLAPGIAWYLHDAERGIRLDFPVDCADWPARYEGLEAPPT